MGLFSLCTQQTYIPERGVPAYSVPAGVCLVPASSGIPVLQDMNSPPAMRGNSGTLNLLTVLIPVCSSYGIT